MSAPVRYSIRGYRMEGSIFASECGDCGMPTLGQDEFHPYEACAAYKDTHNSVYVERLIEPLYRQRILNDPAVSNQESRQDEA